MPDIYGAKINNTQYDFFDGTKVTHDLLKDTVGWSGKNLIPPANNVPATLDNVSVTLNADGSITLDGTSGNVGAQINIITSSANVRIPSGDYRFTSGATDICKLQLSKYTGSGETLLGTDTGNGFTISPTSTIVLVMNIIISANSSFNNFTIYPMLRKADILDDTYEPYHKSVEEEYGEKITSTVSGNTVTFTSNLITSNSVPDGPYIKDVLTELQGVTYSGTTITYTFTDTSADGKEAYLWIRN